MNELPEAGVIRKMHPDNLEVSVDKLARFLCGWLGGPKLYNDS
jgi:hemoglobin